MGRESVLPTRALNLSVLQMYRAAIAKVAQNLQMKTCNLLMYLLKVEAGSHIFGRALLCLVRMEGWG